MADPEDRTRPPLNPYQGPGPHVTSIEMLVVDKLKRILYMCLSGYGLYKLNFYKALLRSPHILHEWFKVGLALTIAMLMIKSYLELYEGKMRRKTINYQNFKNSTHAMIVLFLLASVAFHIALWPHYAWNSPIVLGLFFYGMVLQFLLIVPTYLQNLVGFVGMAYFLQEYQ